MRSSKRQVEYQEEIMIEVRTHSQVDENLCGRVQQLEVGRCSIEFEALHSMRADSTGLVHGGFLFSAADYAAMLAVNEPTVVLAGAEVQFVRPCRVGDKVEVNARITVMDSRKPIVEVVALDGTKAEVFRGTFKCVVPSRHVLESAGTVGSAPTKTPHD